MKKLRYFRHSDKKGQFITPAGLERAKRELPIEPYTDGFYGPLIRTAQTLLAFAEVLNWNLHIHEPIEDVGTEALEAEADTPEFIAAVESGLSNFDAIISVFPHNIILGWEYTAAVAVIGMFSRMKDRGYGIAVGHDPLISLAAHYFGWGRAHSLKTLQYVDFVQSQNGQEISFVAVGP
ncbi:MAG TPA: hypothetical protein VK254_01460 [Candidatus Bathyarchaeia archaeon]|nr:hypothetical protein [Candidatus Bathyarchaeia archaeon]